MKYDFTTLVDRTDTGSGKWDAMKQSYPAIGRDIVPLSVADMEFKTMPEVTDGLKEYLDQTVLGYTSPTASYYQAVTGWMKRRHGWDVSPEEIVCFSGVVPALFLLVDTLTKPEDSVILITPVYYPFYSAVTKNGRSIADVPLIRGEDRYSIDFEALEAQAAKSEVTAMIFCSPHNPVGRVWTKEELRKVSDICLRHGVFVISDEIHFDLIMPGYSHTIFASLSKEAADNCIICTAPSKTFNLAGMTTSNLVIPNKAVREKVTQRMDALGLFSLNLMGYKACELAYTYGGQWLEELLSVLDGNRQMVEDFMHRNLPGIKVYPLEGTYLQWLDFRSLELPWKELEEFMTGKAGLYLDEGYLFGKAGEGFERFNIACPPPVLEKALERLLLAMKQIK